MIDAYEIGIQLALQDDVSAGLAVIARELAEMDRAVAASSAGLAALVQSAEGAVRAVSAVAGVKVPAPPAKIGQVEAGGDNRVAPGPAAVQGAADEAVARGVSAPRPLVPPVEDRAAPVAREPATAPAVVVRATVAPEVPAGQAGADPVLPVAPATVRGPSGLEPVPEPQARQPAEPTVTAVPRAVPSRAREGGRPAGAPIRRDGLGQGVAVARIERQGLAARREERRSPVRQAGVAPRPEVARVAAVLPSVVRDETDEPAMGRQAAAPPRAARAAAVAAPAAPRPEGLSPRGVAPQAEDRERGQAGGGTVMLDGRMVGYWLAEHMAREASRPPGGTSFFDPRQSPAWTPSGAI